MTPPSSTIGLSPEHLEAAFPFHFAINRDLEVVQAGRSLAHLCPGIFDPRSFPTNFKMMRPASALDFPSLLRCAGQPIVIAWLKNEILLRGQFVTPPGDNLIVFLGSPWVTTPGELRRCGLTTADFALHDQISDLLKIVESHQTALADVKQLADALTDKQTQLHSLNDSLHTHIRQRAETERALRDSERNYRSVVMNLTEVIFRTDPAGLWTFLNPAWSEITGFPIDESLGHPFLDYVHPDDRAYNAELFQPLLERKKDACRHEVRYLTKDGGFRWIEVHARLSFDDAGTITGTAGTLNDITDRRLADERFRVLFDHSSDAHLLFDASGIIDCNHAAVQMLRCQNKAEVLKIHPARLSPDLQPDGRPSLEKCIEMDALARTNGLHRFEWTHRRMDGTDFLVEVTLTPVSINDTPALLVVWHDIDERHRYERGLLEARDAAQAANRAKSDFLATMSHEIRTPMNGVIGITNLLLETHLESKQRHYAEMVRGSGEALLTIINDILDYSKIEAGMLDIEAVPFDLQSLAEEVSDLLALRAQQKDLEFVLRCAPGLPRAAIGDPGRIRQILVNLLGNAIKFTSSGHVFLNLECLEKPPASFLLKISVRDSGIGIPPEKQNRLFEKFSQADSSISREYGGTGLGLAICKRLAALMHGSIGVESQPGHGSTFWVTLRLAAGPEPLPAPTPLDPSLNILVVDDHQLTRTCLAEQLSSLNLRHTLAASGHEAIAAIRHAIARHDPFHSILVDVLLPEIDGLPLGRHIHQIPGAATTSLVGMAPANLNTRDDLAAIFPVIISKPVRPSVLLETLSNRAPHPVATTNARAPSALPPEPPPSTSPSHDSCHVLLAEDHPTNQILAGEFLRKLNCHLDVAINGREAVTMSAAQNYDLIFMDCHMPEMDGFAAARAIRSRDAGLTRRIPIIALTANAMAGDRERCLDAGMDDYMTKPLMFPQLKKMLEAWWKPVPLPTPPPAAAAPPPATGAPFDYLSALERLGGDPELLASLASSFCQSYETTRLKIEHAVRDRDATRLGAAAHTLRGTVAMFSAEAAVSLNRQLETAGEAADWTEVDRLHAALDAEMKTLIPALLEISASIVPG